MYHCTWIFTDTQPRILYRRTEEQKGELLQFRKSRVPDLGKEEQNAIKREKAPHDTFVK